MKTYICIDIGGTSIKYGMIREDGTFLTNRRNADGSPEARRPGDYEESRSHCGRVFEYI